MRSDSEGCNSASTGGPGRGVRDVPFLFYSLCWFSSLFLGSANFWSCALGFYVYVGHFERGHVPPGGRQWAYERLTFMASPGANGKKRFIRQCLVSLSGMVYSLFSPTL